MQHKHKLAVALGFLAVIGAVEVAQARIIAFSGTRGQVRGACTGPNRTLVEGQGILGIGWSMCMDSHTNVGVICDDGGGCFGTSEMRVAGNKPKPVKPRRQDYQVPESLSEPVESGEISVDVPAPEPYVDIIN